MIRKLWRSSRRLRPKFGNRYLPWLLQGKHLILTFHQIRPVSERRNEFDSCPSHREDHFRAILKQVQSRYQIVPLSKLPELWQGKNRLAVITFDDGWRDTFDLAAPILASMGIPATVFVTTGKIGSHTCFWQQTLGTAFHLASKSPEGVAGKKLRDTFSNLADSQFTPNCFRRTVLEIKRNYRPDIDEFIMNQFGLCATDPKTQRLFVNEEEIATLAAKGFEIGSHSTSHPLLTKIDPMQLRSEMVESKSRLEAITGKVVESIAYPNGTYDLDVLNQASESGYRIGCTTRSARLNAGHKLLELPRIEPFWDIDEDEFPRVVSRKTWEIPKVPVASENRK